MKNQLLILISTILIVFSGCEKDAEIQPREYPFIITNEVEMIDSTGVTFTASILNIGSEEILDYGFKWKNAESEFMYSLKKERKIEDFELRITNDLKKDIQYFCNAYIQTSKNLILGNGVSFMSKGSLPPVINDFSPKEGFDGTQIIITGSNFSYNKRNNIVTINQKNVEVIYSSEDSIICVLPQMTFYGETNIHLLVGDHSIQSSSKYKILGPEIKSLSSIQSYSGEYISINGNYFTQNGTTTDLYFGELKTNIISINDSQIKAIVPPPKYSDIFQDNTVKLKFENGLKSTEFENEFTIKCSWMKKTSLKIQSEVSKIFTYNDKAYFLNHWQNTIQIYNPETDVWSSEGSSGYPHPTEGSLQIIVGDKMYLVGGYVWGYEHYYELWEYDMIEKIWSRKADLPFSFLTATYFEYNNYIHVITDKGEHWQCDFANEDFIRLNDFPISFEYSFAYSFVSNKKIFAAVYGRTFQYNFSSDSWIELNENPFTKGYYSPHAIGFTYKNSGYIYDTQNRFLYRYNDIEDLWIKTSYVPVSLYNTPRISVFVLNDIVYFEDTYQNNKYMYAYKN